MQVHVGSISNVTIFRRYLHVSLYWIFIAHLFILLKDQNTTSTYSTVYIENAVHIFVVAANLLAAFTLLRELESTARCQFFFLELVYFFAYTEESYQCCDRW